MACCCSACWSCVMFARQFHKPFTTLGGGVTCIVAAHCDCTTTAPAMGGACAGPPKQEPSSNQLLQRITCAQMMPHPAYKQPRLPAGTHT
jgi:hypothetical protein